jgi:hypothetical protein
MKTTSFKKLPLLMLFSCFALTSFAQTTPDELLQRFFTEYRKTPAHAVDQIYSTNPWASRSRDAVEQMINTVNRYTVDYLGQYYGNELIVKKQLSEGFVLYSYIMKYDRQPIRFIFEFYKPNDKWMLYSMKIDGNIDDELEQAAKIYYLDLEKTKE